MRRLALVVLLGCNSLIPADEDESAFTIPKRDAWAASVGLRDDISVDAAGTPRPAGGWYVTPIHTTLLPDGKVFVTGWSRIARDSCSFPDGSRRNGTSFVLDPAKLTGETSGTEIAIAPLAENVESIPGWKTVLYCAGHSPVVIGGETAILMTGGSRYLDLGVPGREIEEGLRSAHLAFSDRIELISKPGSADGWMKGGPLCTSDDGQQRVAGEERARGGKWYATNTRLPDGQVLVTGGFTGGPGSRCITVGDRHNASAELWNPATRNFTALFQPEDVSKDIGEAFAPGDKDYTHTVVLPEPLLRDGVHYQVAMMGYSGQVVLMNTDPGTGRERRFFLPQNRARPGNAPAWDSTFALVSTGELLVMGGSDQARTATKIHLYDPANDRWREIDTGVGRRNPAATLLPDGRVLVINGSRDPSDGLGDGERTRPLLFDPETNAVTTFDGSARERGYHSFSLLTKDGSVLVGGGVGPGTKPGEYAIGCEQTDVQLWKPPYSGTNRPVVDAPSRITMKIGGENTLVVRRGAKLHATRGAALMALGSFTHGFDQNQRYVRLSFTTSNDAVTLVPPKNATIAPPGDYLLFLVSVDGIPSVGQHVRLD